MATLLDKGSMKLQEILRLWTRVYADQLHMLLCSPFLETQNEPHRVARPQLGKGVEKARGYSLQYVS